MDTARTAWHHFRFETPSEWETIGYRNDIVKGQLALSNRRGETLHIFWRQLKAKTGVRNRLADVAVELSEGELKAAQVRKNITERYGWQLYEPDDESRPALAGRYEEESKVLLYLVFPPHPDTADRRIIDSVLKSYQPNDGEERLWAAMGIEIELPKEMELMDIQGLPAAQKFRFENRRGESVTVHRYGFLTRLLAKCGMESFFAGQNKRRMFYRDGEFYWRDKYPGVKLTYKTHGKGGLEGFMARTWLGKVWIWRCDDLQRLYCVDNNAVEDHIIWDLPERVTCR